MSKWSPLLSPRDRESYRRQLGSVLSQLALVLDRKAVMWFSLTCFCVVISGAAAALAPLALKRIIDSFGLLQKHYSNHSFLVVVLPFIAATLGQRVAFEVQNLSYSRGEQLLTQNLSEAAYAHMLDLPLVDHLARRSGEFSQSLSQGALGVSLITGQACITIAPMAVQLAVMACIICIVVGPSILGIIAAFLVLYCVIFGRGMSRLNRPLKSYSSSQVAAAGLAVEGLSLIETIKAYAAEEEVWQRYHKLLHTTRGHWIEFTRRRFQNGLAATVVFAFLVCGATIYAGSLAAQGRISVGSFVLIGTYVIQLVRPIELIGYAIRDIGQGVAYLSQIISALELPKEEHGTQTTIEVLPLSVGGATLRFDAVNFFHGDRHILKDVSFAIDAGSRVGIVGPSGAGKSSIARLIPRLYDPSSGSIVIDGRPLTAHPHKRLREQITFIGQENILFSGTIADNIRFGDPLADEASLQDVAERFGLSELLRKLPDGLMTIVGERGVKLSGGERQRVLVARASLKSARLVVLDEITSALDVVSERQVQDAMRELCAGVTSIIVTHRLSSIRDADEILVIVDGGIADRGSHHDLISREGPYLDLWRTQQSVADRAHG